MNAFQHYGEVIQQSAAVPWIAIGVATLYLLHWILTSVNYPVLSPSELLWNVLVFLIPAKVAFSLGKQASSDMSDGENSHASPSTSETHAAKSEALRKFFRLECSAQSTSASTGSSRRPSLLDSLRRKKSESDAPPGLGNWDNSCYQNSVLQGLSTLQSLTSFLDNSNSTSDQSIETTTGSLRETLTKLNDRTNNGNYIWTPSKLKSMSSWQQQDAQEYFSRIMEDLEKDITKATRVENVKGGLEQVTELDVEELDKELESARNKAGASNGIRMTERNPLEGFLAQRVACTRCGFSEGLSMIPFNCLTVPLGRGYSYEISQCLDEYTNLEEITGVECANCTLLRTRDQLEGMMKKQDTTRDPPQLIELPAEVRRMVTERLQAVENALESSDFSDTTLSKKCQIQKNARVSSTKTRQAVISRPPRSLAIHVNRSIFDEYTGSQKKNSASVSYPHILDLTPWCLGSGRTEEQADEDMERWQMGADQSMVPQSQGYATSANVRFKYQLRAVVSHYGRHENGHYVCYRQHPTFSSQPPEKELAPQETKEADAEDATPSKWWCLSDERVTPVTEEEVVRQGNVFMLFYERIESASWLPVSAEPQAQAASTASPAVNEVVVDADQHVSPAAEASVSVPSEPDSERPRSSDRIVMGNAEELPSSERMGEVPIQKVPSPQLMRTSRSGPRRSDGTFSSALRAVAAT